MQADVEPEHNFNNDEDDSTPLIGSNSPPVTVTHFSQKGKVEKLKLNSESSSVSPGVVLPKRTNIATQPIQEEEEEKEIMLVDGPIATSTPRSNPFSSTSKNPFVDDKELNNDSTTTSKLQIINNNNSTNPFEPLDAITSALLNSTNPFHNPFLSPDNEEKELPGSSTGGKNASSIVGTPEDTLLNTKDTIEKPNVSFT